MGHLYQPRPGGVWMMQYVGSNGRRVRESTGTDNEKKAEKILAAKETDRDRGLPVAAGIGKIRWEEAVDLIRADYANNDQTSWVNQARRIRLHLAPLFGGQRLAEIQPDAFVLYATTRREAGASAASVNRELAIVRRMFVLAMQAGKLLYRPHIPHLRERNARAGFFERATFESVYQHLPEALQPVVQFAYVTGWRIDSEVLTREWRHVDFDANEIRLDPGETKNGEPRVFPLTDELRTLLLERQAARDAAAAAGYVSPWVFFRLVAKGRGGTKYPKKIIRFNKAWTTACAAAGCPGRIPHDFRRTAVRNMVRHGVPERVAMQLAGHLTRSVFERYNIVSPGDLLEARTKLEGQVADVAKLKAKATQPATQRPISGQPPVQTHKNIRKFGGAARI